jgi:hypothetical protein
MLLAQATYQFKPFLTALPVWDYWMWLIVPLCVGVVIVYKSARCEKASQIPLESAKVSVYVLLAMAAAAGALSTITWAMTPR